MMASRILSECPVNGCGWTHEHRTATDAEYRAVFLAGGGLDDIQALCVSMAMESEKAIGAHLDTHTVLDFCTTIHDLRADLAAARRLIPETG